MPLLLVLAFIVVPLVELWVIVEVGGLLGFWPTLLLLLVDSIAGAVLVRREGSRAWRAFRQALGSGRIPDDEILQGALLLFGGALLLTPGFVTDVLGLSLVLPVTRAPVARLIKLRVVPIPFQVGTGMWNSTRTPPTGGGTGQQAGPTGEARGSGGDRRRPIEPSVEVLGIERDDDRDDDGAAPGGNAGAEHDPETPD